MGGATIRTESIQLEVPLDIGKLQTAIFCLCNLITAGDFPLPSGHEYKPDSQVFCTLPGFSKRNPVRINENLLVCAVLVISHFSQASTIQKCIEEKQIPEMRELGEKTFSSHKSLFILCMGLAWTFGLDQYHDKDDRLNCSLYRRSLTSLDGVIDIFLSGFSILSNYLIKKGSVNTSHNSRYSIGVEKELVLGSWFNKKEEKPSTSWIGFGSPKKIFLSNTGNPYLLYASSRPVLGRGKRREAKGKP